MTSTKDTPNLYQLRGHGLHVTYSTSSIDGRPRLSYQDTHQMHSFVGNEIRLDPSEVGTLVTVTLQNVPDLGSTTFTLLIPRVRLSDMNSAQITTTAITTLNRSSIAPVLDEGQTQLYRTHRLTGMARSVLF
jgi:hypothetical protein